MPPTVRYLERDGATQPAAITQLSHAVAGRVQTARKFGLENISGRVLGGPPFNGAALHRLALGADTDGLDQLRIGLDAATLSPPWSVAAVLGPAADGGVWAAPTTAFYKVTARGAGGETVGSREVTVAVDDATKRVTLSWPPVPGADGYAVWRSAVTEIYSPTALVAELAGGGVVSYVDDGTAAGAGAIPLVNTTGAWTLAAVLSAPADGGVWPSLGARFWRVVALDATGVEIAATLEATVAVDDVTKRVALTWPAVAAAASFLVYRSVISELYAAALRATLGPGATGYTDDGDATGPGDYVGGASYGLPPALGLGPLATGEIPDGQHRFFWVGREVPAAAAADDELALVKLLEF